LWVKVQTVFGGVVGWDRGEFDAGIKQVVAICQSGGAGLQIFGQPCHHGGVHDQLGVGVLRKGCDRFKVKVIPVFVGDQNAARSVDVVVARRITDRVHGDQNAARVQQE
jgi:hypothetical protein